MKLQRKAQDIVKAYSLVSSTIADLEHLRASDDEVAEWYEQAILLGESVGSEPRVWWITGRQQHRENVDSSTPEEYYRRSVILPFLDHLITDMKARFNSTATAASQRLSLVPEVLVEQEDPTTKIAQLGEIYAADLPNPTTLSTDIRKWRRKWDSTVPLPNTPIAVLQQCDPDVFPNINTLLKLACMLPVSATENERSHSALKHLKQYLIVCLHRPLCRYIAPAQLISKRWFLHSPVNNHGACISAIQLLTASSQLNFIQGCRIGAMTPVTAILVRADQNPGGDIGPPDQTI